jgi:hypothetical protein
MESDGDKTNEDSHKNEPRLPDERSKFLQCVKCHIVTIPPWQTCSNGHLICSPCEKLIRDEANPAAFYFPGTGPDVITSGPKARGSTTTTTTTSGGGVATRSTSKTDSNVEKNKDFSFSFSEKSISAEPLFSILQQPQCPECKTVLKSPLPRAALALEALVDTLDIFTRKCPNDGCSVRIPFSGKNFHVEGKCIHRKGNCIHPGCKWNGTVIDYWKHTIDHGTIINKIDPTTENDGNPIFISKLIKFHHRQSLVECAEYRFVIVRTEAMYSLLILKTGTDSISVHVKLKCISDDSCKLSTSCKFLLEPRNLGIKLQLFGDSSVLGAKSGSSHLYVGFRNDSRIDKIEDQNIDKVIPPQAKSLLKSLKRNRQEKDVDETPSKKSRLPDST